MFKYAIEFSKNGTICYISHLDLMRVFKRAFKKAGIKQSYSKGFNPHPKMGFAQPLSLGYRGLKEYMEFETTEDYEPEYLKKALSDMMPDGLNITSCKRLEGMKKTMAAMTEAAEYMIAIPLKKELGLTGEKMSDIFMARENIIRMKKQKKKKEFAEVDIKPMIRNIIFTPEKEKLFLTAELDSGSTSNLSPELLIEAIEELFGIETPRNEIEVMRTKIKFQNM